MVAQLTARGVRDIVIHDDAPARMAAATLGVHAFCYGRHIALGATVDTGLGPTRQEVLRHELVHVAQVHCGLRGARVAASAQIEAEADALAALDEPDLSQLSGAAPSELHPLWWLLPLAAGVYAFLRPNNANAPGPTTKTEPSISPLQIGGEAFVLFGLPVGTTALAGRLGLGFFGTSAMTGAAMSTSWRGVQDLGQGHFSGVPVYVFDAATGAVIGVVVPGGIRLIGKAGNVSLDWLATQGMRHSDIQLTKVIADRAAVNPIGAAELEQMFAARRLYGRVAQWWLDRRGTIILYRGQGEPTVEILSPLAREQGVAASESLVARMRAVGITDDEIAKYAAVWHSQPVPPAFTAPELAWQSLGAVGIPTSTIPGMAANFGGSGVMYVIRLPKSSVVRVPPWGLALENEWVVLNKIPKDAVVSVVPASRVPPLTVDETGKIILGRR